MIEPITIHFPMATSHKRKDGSRDITMGIHPDMLEHIKEYDGIDSAIAWLNAGVAHSLTDAQILAFKEDRYAYTVEEKEKTYEAVFTFQPRDSVAIGHALMDKEMARFDEQYDAEHGDINLIPEDEYWEGDEQ